MSLIEREKTLKRLLAMADQTGLITTDSVEYILASEPSAQPEIIRCRDCKYWDIKIPYLYKNKNDEERHNCDCVMRLTKENDYCSWAKRRTDECTD